MDNPNFDLVEELAKKASSVWRLDQYLNDAKSTNNCQHCVELWQKMKELDTQAVDMLQKEIVMHVQSGVFK
ncbi:MAG: hypothetical protein DKM50_08550 [Candidatus Margulisiibacteriota bacterium]|nr:MAG: hypothetical protein A2X43_11895 [Candidatus Margulisbacteria bacterium GWD2_39_127]OGI01841.1 MAG: hypothetical protein A2X42_04420 [Candidatus Margulisbacteria bacterium GWF2_38_17]OGI10163.1 MAG: hypothetical protein A2X41_01140 [Candidatus Margulisbacteria bacterium GWE2_39_32]PZM79500.1 MAG: hypothetical protein DKM50_08550 [Candidatus Margulisiibacteriota bacterium]HAR63829.1 hypothetical protein [Candidatus Margulisiibacteriota bacterium]